MAATRVSTRIHNALTHSYSEQVLRAQLSTLKTAHTQLQKELNSTRQQVAALQAKLSKSRRDPAVYKKDILESDQNQKALKNRLTSYFQLLKQDPLNFGYLGKSQHGEIEIITDLKTIQKIEKDTQQHVGIVGESNWHYWICDPVKWPKKNPTDEDKYGIYFRLCWKNSLKNSGTTGGASLAYTPDGKILLACIHRHGGTRHWELETIRGCANAGEATLATIRRELGEEAGAEILPPTPLGTIAVDTGCLFGEASIAKVQITKYSSTDRDPAEQSMTLHAFSKAELKDIIRKGSTTLELYGRTQTVLCRDPFLNSALFLDEIQPPKTWGEWASRSAEAISKIFCSALGY